MRSLAFGFSTLEAIRDLFENLEVGFYGIDNHGKFFYADPELLRILGVASFEELQLEDARNILNGDPSSQHLGHLRQERGIKEFDRVVEGRVRKLLNIVCKYKNLETDEIFFRGIIVDISELRLYRQLEGEQNIRDSLTGCYTPHYLKEFERLVTDERETWGVIFIYIDRFRQFKERYGSEATADVLRKMGRFLMRHSRANDAIIRINDQEFLIVLFDIGSYSLGRVLKRIKTAALGQAPLAFSVGWAVRQQNEDIERTIFRANSDLAAVRVLERAPKTRS